MPMVPSGNVSKTNAMTLKLCQLVLLAALNGAAICLAWAQAPQPLSLVPVPIEVLSFKLVSYYNPLLQLSNPSSADARELPRTPAERVANAQRTTARSPQERANEVGIPPGATRCQVLNARETATLTGESKLFEYVCGRGFADPSLLREKPVPVTLKRIEYKDGSVWP